MGEPTLVEHGGKYYVKCSTGNDNCSNEWSRLAIDGTKAFFDLWEGGEFVCYVQNGFNIKNINTLIKEFRLQGSVYRYVEKHKLPKWVCPYS